MSEGAETGTLVMPGDGDGTPSTGRWPRTRKLKPILEGAADQAQHFELKAMKAEINRALHDAFTRPGRARRDVGNGRGSVRPRNTDRHVEQASKGHDGGSLRIRSSSSQITIDFIDDEESGAFHVDIASKRVALNRSVPYIADLIRGHNQACLFSIAVMALMHSALISESPQRTLRFVPADGTESERLSRALRLAFPEQAESRDG